MAWTYFKDDEGRDKGSNISKSQVKKMYVEVNKG